MAATGHAELSFEQAFTSVVLGAVSGAVTCGIGGAVGTIGQFGTKIAVQAAAHGVFQGIMSAGQGGKFWSGFAAGAVSSLASSLWTGGDLKGGDGHWGGLGGKFAESLPGMILFGTVSGGAAASLSGGNFWQGAVTGLIVSALNHAMHMGDDDGPGDDPKPKSKSKNQIRKETVKPSAAKLLEVEGNTLGVVELARDSKMAQFVRGGAPKAASVSKVLKVGGNTLGVVGIGFETAEVYNGNMSYTEFGVDTIFALAPIVCPALAPVSLGYFAGKAIYEYSSGNTLFTKPK